MSREILSIPQSRLGETIQVILVGLEYTEVSKETERALRKWCQEESDYLQRIAQSKLQQKGVM